MTAYHRPTDLDEALALLAAQPLTLAAGCTDLFPATKARALPGPILDITAISTLRGIAQTDAGWRIGAATTWTDILRADLPAAFHGLKLAAREVGSVQIQNAGTIAGNLCTASPAGDGIPCLMTLDATVELQSNKGTRTLALQDFITGARRIALQPGELITAIHIPETSAKGDATFLKLGARKYLIISIAMVAARIVTDGDIIQNAAISIGACSAVAARLTALEQYLQGQRLTTAAQTITQNLISPHLSPIDDIRADAANRITAATELTRRALRSLAAHSERRAA